METLSGFAFAAFLGLAGAIGLVVGESAMVIALFLFPMLFAVSLILAVIRRSKIWVVVCVITGVLSLVEIGGFFVFLLTVSAG